jgi:hypothetical protein
MKIRAADRVFGGLIVDPVGNAAADVAIAGALIGADLRIVAPFLRAAAGIDRNHLVERRAENQAVLDKQRGRLELAARHHGRRAGIEIAGSKFPGAHEIADIIARDLGERRKPRAATISSPMLPAERWYGNQQRDGEHAEKSSHGKRNSME